MKKGHRKSHSKVHRATVPAAVKKHITAIAKHAEALKKHTRKS